MQKQALLFPYHFFKGIKLKNKIRVQAKIRSHQDLERAVLVPCDKNKIKLVFDKLQKAITPGQFAVFYKGNICLGGGKIQKN
ncbi:MAG: aminomethyltransferase beta-barrel domain-containing protein [Patescibacteria group bacterium]